MTNLLTSTEKKIQKHNLESVVTKLNKIGLTIVDRDDLKITLDEYGKAVSENRMLRAKLARKGAGK